MNSYKKYIIQIILLLLLFSILSIFVFIYSAKYIPDDIVVRNSYEYLKIKTAFTNLNKKNKIIILSGSNAFYGFRANVFEEITGLPTINMAVQGGLGVSYMLYYIKPYLKKGDILILPLEYNVLLSNEMLNFLSVQTAYAFGLGYFMSLPLFEKIKYLRVFKKEYFLESVKRSFIRNRPYIDHNYAKCVNSHGDFVCNQSTNQTRQELKEVLQITKDVDDLFSASPTLPPYDSLNSLAKFFPWAKENNITIIGTYPNSIKTLIKDKGQLKKIKTWYEQHHQIFIGEVSESLYSVDNMYDTSYHLNDKTAELRTITFAHRFCNETKFCKK